jgi:anti-sigma B factor antagonist
MSLQVFERVVGGVTILDLHGRVTIGASSDLLNRKMQESVDAGSHKLLVNLAHVIQIDSTGIASLVRTFVGLARRGGSLKLLHAQGRVREILELTRLLNSIPTFDDEAKALASFD